jgi:hypothetical protein
MVIRIRKSKNFRPHNSQRKWTKRQTIVDKTLHRKLEIEQHKPYYKPEEEFRCSENLRLNNTSLTTNRRKNSGAPKR